MPNLGISGLLHACRGAFPSAGSAPTATLRPFRALLRGEGALHLETTGARPAWRAAYQRWLDRLVRRSLRERMGSPLGERLGKRMVILSGIFARQCTAIAAQRLRRAVQIVVLYRNLGYDQELVRNVMERLGNGFRKLTLGSQRSPLYLLCGAVMFTWDQNKISEEELTSVADEVTSIRRDASGLTVTGNRFDEWEKIIDKAHLTAWRKPVANSYLYEYKVYGTYDDLPARAFFTAQVDLEFRKQWDKLVISLDVVDREKETETEVVQWITHFPYPMYSREYLYVRRSRIDADKKVMVIVNRSVDHPAYPVDKRYVRVDTYISKMVIKPHTSFDENGFDYVLTYFDDPKSSFPSVAYNWMANTGVPDFVDKVHKAALYLHERRKKYLSANEETEDTPSKDSLPM